MYFNKIVIYFVLNFLVGFVIINTISHKGVDYQKVNIVFYVANILFYWITC